MKYCEQCGSALINKKIRADKIEMCYSFDGSLPLGQRYNSGTGKEQYGIVVICPNRRWFNSHTEYVDENQKLIN